MKRTNTEAVSQGEEDGKENSESNESVNNRTDAEFRAKKGIKEIVMEFEEKHKHEPYIYRRCCEHYHPPYPCPYFCLKYFVRTLPASFTIYFPVHLLPLVLFKRKQLVNETRKTLWNFAKSTAKSVIFLNVFQAIMVVVMCTGNKLLKSDHWISVGLCGFLAAFSVVLEKLERRKEMMLYCIPRVMEAVTNCSIERDLVTKESMNKSYVIMFSIASAILFYLYQYNDKSIKPSILSLLKKLIGQN